MLHHLTGHDRDGNRLARQPDRLHTYDDAGRPDLAEFPNGVDTDYGYDDANRLTDLTNTGPGPTTISDYHYELDAAGNRTEMTDLSGTHEYVYDVLYRLTEVTYPDPETDAYTYDANGNRKTLDALSYTYDAADQLQSAGAVNFDYDGDGNMTDRGSDTFTYDHENRLIESVIGGVTSTAEYNGHGLRMSLEVDDGVNPPTTTEYVWNINAGLPVILDDGANQYVYGLDLIAAIDVSDDETYFLYDGLGSTTELLDDAGDVTDAYTYDVFGAIRASSGSSANPWLFMGEQADADSGLQYLRARYYDPVTGRFIGKDPLPVGNRYSYVGNNPTRFADPYGLFGCDTGLFGNPCDWIGNGWDWIVNRGDDIAAAVQHLYENPQGILLGNHFNQALGVLLASFSSCDREEKGGGIVLYTNCGGLAGWISDDLLNGRTFVIGSFIFSSTEPEPALLAHELAHVKEYDWLGKNFFPYYFGNALGAYASCAANSSNSSSVSNCAEERNLLELLADELAGTNEVY